MKFLSLITRYLNEPFLEEFIEYYFSEGVDHIFVLYDTDSTIPIDEHIKNNPNVSIIESHNFRKRQTMDVNHVFSQIRTHFKWNIFIDCDEFITSTLQYKTIRDELSERYRNVDCIKIPWIMMSYDNIKKDPPSILQYLTKRWNHDLKHPHPNNWNKGRCRYNDIEVKSICKCSKFNSLGLHHPLNPVQPVKCIESITNNDSLLNPFYKGFREKDIETGSLLCYHYRIFSKESAKRKFLNNKLDGYSAENYNNLLLSDYPEKEELFMKNKSIAKFGHKN